MSGMAMTATSSGSMASSTAAMSMDHGMGMGDCKVNVRSLTPAFSLQLLMSIFRCYGIGTQ